MRKKLFAILMSAMMMVTFMPAMAFAAAATGWSDDYKYYTNSDGTQVASTIYLSADAQGDWNGKFEAVAGTEKVPFTDYSYAEVATISGDATDLSTVAGISKSKMESIFGKTPEAYVAVTTLKFTAMYTVSGNAKILSSTGTKATYNKNVTGFKMETPNSKYDAAKKYEDQVLSLAVKAPVLGEKEIGAVPAKSLKIIKENTSPSAATYTLDGVDCIVDYTGEEYTLTQTELPGVTSTYYVKGTDGKYAKVDAVKVKDVKDTTHEGDIKAVATDGKTEKDHYPVLAVNAANNATFGFEQKDIADKTFYVKAGFNAADYMVIKTEAPTGTDEEKAAKKAADKKALAANEALLKEYFNDFYVIKTEAKKYDATDVTATMEKKPQYDLDKLTLAERTALVAKYGNMLKNFGKVVNNDTIDTPQFSIVNGTANFVLTDEIEWVKAPLTKKYYNKKGTLKKTYTFAVEAKADSKVTYTLQYGGSMIKIEKNTGKVTVKKGLKVGTYTVKVTAKAGRTTNSYYMTIQMAKKK